MSKTFILARGKGKPSKIAETRDIAARHLVYGDEWSARSVAGTRLSVSRGVQTAIRYAMPEAQFGLSEQPLILA